MSTSWQYLRRWLRCAKNSSRRLRLKHKPIFVALNFFYFDTWDFN
jgi:hypothetical protein